MLLGDELLELPTDINIENSAAIVRCWHRTLKVSKTKDTLAAVLGRPFVEADAASALIFSCFAFCACFAFLSCAFCLSSIHWILRRCLDFSPLKDYQAALFVISV